MPLPPQSPELASAFQGVTHELQAQSIAMSQQLQAMTASRRDLVARIRASNPSEVARLQEALAQHDATFAELQARLLDVNAKLIEVQTSTQPPFPPPIIDGRPPWNIDPGAITGVFVMFSIAIALPLSIGLIRRMWRRPQLVAAAPRDAEAVSKARFDRLEQAVDSIAIEIERISEGQRFVTKVLAERPVMVRQAAANEASEQAGLGGEGKPFLALGAGPIEPIRVAERQAVKQSITPH